MWPAACPGPCPRGLCIGLDLGIDTLWKAPNMLCLAVNPKKLQCVCVGGGGRRGGQLAAGTPPSGNRGLLLAPSQAPLLSLSCPPSRSSIQGLGLTVSVDGNGQSSTSPAGHVRGLVLCVPPGHVRGLVLCVPQHLICLCGAHSSCPCLHSRLPSLLSSPCSGPRGHSCPSF